MNMQIYCTVVLSGFVGIYMKEYNIIDAQLYFGRQYGAILDYHYRVYLT